MERCRCRKAKHKWKDWRSPMGAKLRGKLCEKCGSFQFSPQENGYELVTDRFGVTQLIRLGQTPTVR